MPPSRSVPARFFRIWSFSRGKRSAGVIEVETGESVNNLEVMAQWVHFAKARVPFHLYVPVTGYDSGPTACGNRHKVRVTEVWTYRPAAEGFDLVRMWHDAAAVAASTRAANAAGSGRVGCQGSAGGEGRRSRQAARGPQSRAAADVAKSRPRSRRSPQKRRSPPPRRVSSRRKPARKRPKSPRRRPRPPHARGRPVPFIRHTRDKRGYESLLVMHAYRSSSHEGGRSRVLYLLSISGAFEAGPAAARA